MTDLEREEVRQFNGHMIEDLYRLGCSLVPKHLLDKLDYPFLPDGWTIERWHEVERMHQQGNACDEPR